MTAAALDVETFGPNEPTQAEVVDFVAELRARGLDAPEARARLVSTDGKEVLDLPEELFKALKFVAENLAEGRAVSVAPIEKQLTTQEAAEFLGMSRPTLIKIIERDELPCTKIGRHRKVRLGDLIDYQHRAAADRRRIVDDMVDMSLEHDLYQATAGSPEGIR